MSVRMFAWLGLLMGLGCGTATGPSDPQASEDVELGDSLEGLGLDELTTLLEEGADPVRAHVASYLGGKPEWAREVVPFLIEALTDADEGIRESAAFALGHLGSPASAAVPSLTRILERFDPQSSVRLAATFALGKIGASAASAVPVLVRALDSSHPDEDKRETDVWVRRQSIFALGEIGAGQEIVIPALIACLDSDASVQPAIEALGRFGSSAVPGLIEELGRTPSPKLTVVEALSRSGAEDPSVVVDALTSDHRGIQIGAMMAIERMGKKALPALLQAMKDEDETVRAQAAFVVGALGHWAKEALPSLRRALADSSLLVRRHAAASFVRLGPAGAPAVEELREGARSQDAEWRLNCIMALGRIGRAAKDAASDVAQSLEDPDETIRRETAWTLGDLASLDEETVRKLGERLGDDNLRVRQATARSLKLLGPVGAPALPAMGAALDDEDAEVRRTVVAAMRRLKTHLDAGLRERLQRLMREDPDRLAREYAAQALTGGG